MVDRQGSAARLASYRDGALTATKFAGKGHWEKHVADELIHIFDGMARLDVVGEDGLQSLALRTGVITVIPAGTWHRFRSAEGVTLMTATPFSERDDRGRSRRPSNAPEQRDMTEEFAASFSSVMQVCFRVGFRMPARRERWTRYRADVRKPPKNEPAGKR
jgi:uncharacterized cupin superfamily protein